MDKTSDEQTAKIECDLSRKIQKWGRETYKHRDTCAMTLAHAPTAQVLVRGAHRCAKTVRASAT